MFLAYGIVFVLATTYLQVCKAKWSYNLLHCAEWLFEQKVSQEWYVIW